RFDYGPGNASLTPTVGISSGKGTAWQTLPGYDGATSLTNANSVQWTLAAGFRDIGAYEFAGNSSDVTPPTVVATTPPTAGSAPTLNQLGVTFSEGINSVDALNPA